MNDANKCYIEDCPICSERRNCQELQGIVRMVLMDSELEHEWEDRVYWSD